MRTLHWEGITDPLPDRIIRGAELLLGVDFPEDYRECVRLYHQCQPLECEVSIQSEGEEMHGGWGYVLTLDPRCSESVFRMLEADGHPEGIVPIMIDGGGGGLCLDYRASAIPSVVYWDQHLDDADNYLFVADTLSEIAETAYIPDDCR